jgi:hypothetical protein
MRAGGHSTVRSKSVLLGICVLLLTDCAKRSVAPVATLGKRPRTMAIPGATPPSIPTAPKTSAHSRRTEANRLKSGSRQAKKTVAAVKAGPEDKQPVGNITVDVPVAGVTGRSRVGLASAVRDALDIVAKNELTFECPARMHVGSEQLPRLIARRNLNDRLQAELISRGIPAADAAAAVILVTADLTSPDKDAFQITAESPAQTWDSRIWRVEPRRSGDRELDLTVLLSARVSSVGEVQAKPVVLTQAVVVDAGRFYPFRDFMNRYWTALMASMAGLAACIWIFWMFWRGHSALSQR